MRGASDTKRSWGVLDPAPLHGAYKRSPLITQDTVEEYCRALVSEKSESWSQMDAETIFLIFGLLSDPHQHTNLETHGQSLASRREAPDEVLAEIVALRKEIAQLKEEQQRELSDLRDQLQKLERKVDDLTSYGPAPDTMARRDDATESEASSPDPYRIWLTRNRDLLKAYPNSFVAIDLDRGIILATGDEAEFVAKLREMPDAVRERLLTIHTSAYV